ncbi:hypothetical protein [Deinococcus sp.]|uniref:hypothetical protein n=1 Tax=Deinococcus sp. TaxID=47478 RepID=UPI0025EFB73F|nr:hypothetical protein [Deinococcus sp.]
MKRLLLTPVLTLVCAAASAALAEGATCDTSGTFAYSGVTVVLADRLYFRDDLQKQTGRYVVKGDFVAVRNVKDYGACVLYIGETGKEYAGWLDNAGLDPATDPGIQDLPSTWIMVRNQGLILNLKMGSKDLIPFAAEFNRPGKLPITLTGTLELDGGVGPVFLATGKLNGKTSCDLSGVLLSGFLRLFSSAPACRAFAGVYASERFFIKE